MKRCELYILMLIIGLVVSCEKDNSSDEMSNSSSNVITFTTDMLESKGTPLTTETFNNFGVYGYNSSGTYTFTNTEVYKNSAGYWEYANTKEWVQNNALSFEAYAPYSSGSDDFGISPTISNGALSVSYSVPSTCTNQPDLMLARSDGSVYENAVSLNFVHALATVQFKVKGFSSTVKVESIELMGNLAVSGTVTLDSNGDTSWSEVVESDAASYFVEIDNDVVLDPTEANNVITSDGYLMMIPNQYSETDIRINIILNDEGVKEEISYLFSESLTWLAGVSYTYTIEREIREISLDYTSDDDSNCYMIHPYSRVTQSVYIPISSRINDFWSNYSNDSSFTAVDADTELTAEVLWFDTDLDDYITENIKEIGFELECVNSGYENADCAQALKITVPDGLTNGNILVGIKNENGDILWSWHLWITSYNPDVTPIKLQTIYGGGDYVYTVTNGYVHKYAGTMWESGGVYASSYIMGRNIGDWYTTGEYTERRGMLYQFGRKDPFMYDIAPTVVTGNASFATSAMNPTTFYANGEADWCSEGLTGSYLWNDTNVTSSTGKSIFDPSPLGWRMPISGTWSDFSTSNISNYYYRPGTTSQDHIYYPTSGIYNTDGIFDVLNYTYVWSATSGISFIMGSSTTATAANSYRSYGFSVRPVRDL